MTATVNVKARHGLALRADTAADLMTPNPISVEADALVGEAIALLIDRGISAAPVIDEAGRPIGVLSRSDILVHDRECCGRVGADADYYHRAELTTRRGEPLPAGFEIENVDRTLVRDLMTPAVFAVAPDSSAPEVVSEMLSLKVHRLFVVDACGVLVGVISALDVLRYLKP
jgi:CBS domain-containing protein